MKQIHNFKSSSYKTLWVNDKDEHFIVSTIDTAFGQETMIFNSDNEGNVTDYQDLFVVFSKNSHVAIVDQFVAFLETKDGT